MLIMICGPYTSGTGGGDAVLRIPGESKGADLDVQRAGQLGLRIFLDPGEIPARAQVLG